ncbi:uncharacterized protein LOC124124938 [Haliotis rufescens]|uniref:uncharacterized protein LOC124124938 n=1 Tax=Haliotis rufescens TaxID=6454 RepID=UPI00201F8347|nr:uncharacterized protein LOC124124938 [Haliotis rufescens]
MEGKVYTVQEIIAYFEGKTDERFNCEIEAFARGNTESAKRFRNMMKGRRSVHPDSWSTAVAESARGHSKMKKERPNAEPVSEGHISSANVEEEQIKGVSEGDYTVEEEGNIQNVTSVVKDGQLINDSLGGDVVNVEDNMQHVTNVVNDVHITGATGVDEEGSMKQVTGTSSNEDVDSSDVGVEHVSGVTGGDVDNSTVVGVVKGGMRNKQTVIDSDICITGGRGQPDGDDTGADDKPKEVTGVAGGAVKDSTVVGEVHGGMENEQTIENSKIYSDGGFGGNLQFLDLNIRQREDSGEQQDGAVQIIKDCIIDLRKPDDQTDKTEEDNYGDADCDQGQASEEPDEDTDQQAMQKEIQEVKEQSEREEETRRLMQEKQATMEEQLQNEQRERRWMQSEMQRISYEQQQNAAYRGYPPPVARYPPPVATPAMPAGGVVITTATPTAYGTVPTTYLPPVVGYPPPGVFNPPMAVGGLVVAPARPNSGRPKGTGLLKNIKHFIKGGKQ